MTDMGSSGTTSPIRPAAFLLEREFWLLILLGLVFFRAPLFLGETFYYRDLYSHFLPRKMVFAEMLRSGECPLWDPTLQGGQPLLANPNNTILYPTSALYLVLPLLAAFNLDICFHFLLCSASAYLLSRLVGLDRLPALVSGLTFGYCGYTLSLGNLLNRLLAMPYVPLLTFLWHLFLVEGKRRYFLLSVAAALFQMLSGAPETCLLTYVFLLLWTLLFPYAAPSTGRRVASFGLLLVLALGMFSVQGLPAAEMTLNSSRAAPPAAHAHEASTPDATPDAAAFSTWSLHPKALPEMILPGFLGRTDTLAAEDYWGAPLVDQGFPLILSIYFGCLTLALAFLGSRAREGDRMGWLRFRRFLLVFSLACFVLSCGRFLPGFDTVLGHLPLVAWLRYPIKFLNGAVLPVALLSGMGVQSLPGGAKRPAAVLPSSPFPGGLLGIFWTVSVFLAVVTALFLASSGFASWLQRFFFSTFRPQIEQGLRISFLHAAGVWLAATLLLQLARYRSGAWKRWAVGALLAVDLLAAGRSVNVYAPREFFAEPELPGIVRKHIGDGRLYRVPTSEGVVLHAPANDVLYQYRWNLEVLNGYLAPLYGIPIIYNEDLDEMAPLSMTLLARSLPSLPWNRKLPLLSAGSARLILTDEEPSVEGITPIARVRNISDRSFTLYRNEKSAGVAELVHFWKYVGSEREALGAMLADGFDPKRHAAIEGAGAEPSPCAGRHDGITLTARTSSSAAITVSADCGGYLVFSEPYYPGWEVLVDGKRRPLLRANSAFSAVFLEPGEHRVIRRYRPRSVFIGLLASVSSCALLVVATWRRWYAL